MSASIEMPAYSKAETNEDAIKIDINHEIVNSDDNEKKSTPTAAGNFLVSFRYYYYDYFILYFNYY